MKVIHFQRKPRPLGNFSIESYFNMIRELAPIDILFEVNICPYFSTGVFKRVINLFQASFKSNGDILHVTGDVQYLPIAMKKDKTILTIHDCGNLKGKSKLVYHIIRWFWLQWPANKSTLITVNSKATKEELLSYINYDRERIRVIYICIKDSFKYSPKIFNTSKPNILQIGTAPNKNLERLIIALRGISCKLTILGKLTIFHKKALEEYSIDYLEIDHALSDESMLELYQQSDIVSFISTLEGFGMPILEANAVGRVVVTSNLSSMPEIAGDAAVFVDPMDTENINDGIRKVIADAQLREQLISKGKENVKRFNKFLIAQQYYDLYRNVYNNNLN